MSEDWGADHIPRPRGTRQNLVEALSAAQHMPLDALEEAIRRPAGIVEAVLAAATRAAAGENPSDRERNLLFWGLHVLGQVRETRLCAPLLAMLRLPGERAMELVGEIVATTLPKIVVGTFDGDADRIEEALADRDGDELIRWGLFAAYAFLVDAGRIGHARAHAFLVRFDDERLARAGDAAWAGWEEAIALLGLRDLEFRRDAALAEGRLLPAEEDGFAAMLQLAEADPPDPTRFDVHGIGYLDDAIGELEEALDTDEDGEPEAPIHNPLRDVGRNDPCPCGSGKKFKKCCLDAQSS